SSFVTGLAEVNEEGGNVDKVLDDLDLDSIRVAKTLKALAGTEEQFAQALIDVNDETAIANALSDEAARRNDTLAGAFQLLKNEIIDVGLSFSEEAGPVIKDFITDTIIPLVQKFKELSPEIKKFILLGLGIAAALGPALIILGTLLGIIGGAISGFAGLIAVVVPLSGTFLGIVASLGLFATPLAAILTGIGLIVGAVLGLAVVANFDTILEQFENIGNAALTAGEEIIGAFSDLGSQVIDFAIEFKAGTFEG
ncbi:unnamed protein product, partial [marine sediment metagenome]